MISSVLQDAEHLLDPECLSTPQDRAKFKRVVHIFEHQKSVPSKKTKGQARDLRHPKHIRSFCWVKLLHQLLGDLYRHTNVRHPLFQPCQVLRRLLSNPDFQQWVLRIKCCFDLPSSMYKELLVFGFTNQVLERPLPLEVVAVDTFCKLT